MQCTANLGCFPPGKTSSHSTVLPSFLFFFSCVQGFRVSIPPAMRPTLLQQMDMGCLTCAQIWVHCLTREWAVRHKQVCTRVDSEGSKNCSSLYPLAAVCGLVGQDAARVLGQVSLSPMLEGEGSIPVRDVGFSPVICDTD